MADKDHPLADYMRRCALQELYPDAFVDCPDCTQAPGRLSSCVWCAGTKRVTRPTLRQYREHAGQLELGEAAA